MKGKKHTHKAVVFCNKEIFNSTLIYSEKKASAVEVEHFFLIEPKFLRGRLVLIIVTIFLTLIGKNTEL